MSKIISPATLETDPAKVAAAERIVRIVLGEEEGDPAYKDDPLAPHWGISQKMLNDAGKALANQYYFAIEEQGIVEVVAIRHFEKHKDWRGEPDPIDHLMPRFDQATSCSWIAPMDKMKTPEAAAVFLQKQGFRWSESFQAKHFGDPALTASLAKALSQNGQVIEKRTPLKKKSSGPRR